jgi:HD-GYP domain-containing protein (c-di-GMP phosphodiesterase class II)
LKPATQWAPKTIAIVLAAIFAVTIGVVAYAAEAWPQLENETIDMRFGLRRPSRPADVVVVAIDDKTFSDLRLQWPFPRKLHADVIKQLHADGAKTIVYDIQFTEPTTPPQDIALYSEIGRVGGVVLATTEVDAAGETDVLGGEANLRRVHAMAAASNLPADPGGVIRRYQYRQLGLPSLAVAAARADGHPISPARFGRQGAWIDFRGPPGTIPTVSFSDVLRGKVPPQTFAGKVVVVGASAATLQDVHPTSTASTNPMSGPEIQANAIWTALHGNPLQPAPAWLGLIAILLTAIAAPVASLRFRVSIAALVAVSIAGAYLLLAQLAFDAGTIVSISYPLAGWGVGMVGMVAANYVGALIERDSFSRRLSESQRELIQRLAHAVEFRDAETGEHIQRIGVLCERLALSIGWKPTDAEMLRYASAMHDIGKIGVPDRVLLKRGRLDAEEWAIIRTHPIAGGEILAGSSNPLLQLAEEIARTHHERWDGSGYPAGLKGREIPLSGRICSICDVYDALVSRRSYKASWKVDDALAEIERGSGTRFDPELVVAFMRMAPVLTDDVATSATRAKPNDRAGGRPVRGAPPGRRQEPQLRG